MAGMVPEDVYALTGVGDPRLHPDGDRVAYVQWWTDKEVNEYRGAIWLARLDGSEPPRQLPTGPHDSAPRWSPDGTNLAFTSKRGEDKAGQVYVLPFGGGEATKLTELKEDVSGVAWSPDGARIAFSARVRDEAYDEEDEKKRRPRRFTRVSYKLDNVGWTGDRRQHLFVVAADGSGDVKQVTDGDFEHAAPTWSPDGRSLAFISQRDDDWDTKVVSDVYVMAVDGGEPRKVTSSDGECDLVVWSPDGSELAFLYTPGVRDWPRHSQVAIVPAEGGKARILTTSLDRTCGGFPAHEPIWNGARIVFAVEDHGNVHLYDIAADGSTEPRLIIGGEQAVISYDVADERVVYVASRATTLPELYAGERQLTDVGAAFRDECKLVEPERFTARSKDGSEVDCWLVRPAEFTEGSSYPALLSIHGGPFAQYQTAFFDEFQIYAGAGYAVVYTNPRGSSGYTEEWGRAIRGPSNGQGPGWGTVDYEDVMAAVDTALERYDFIDSERLGVLGGSYGGYMTSWIVSHTNRFKAACSERAVNNFVSAYGSSDLFWHFEGVFGASLYEDFQAWVEHSPSMYAGSIETPLLVMHSENDLRCNVEQAEHLFITLRLAGKETELVRFPAESHELSRSGSPAHRVMRFEILLEWFDRYLKP